jgi:hypothetical protein
MCSVDFDCCKAAYTGKEADAEISEGSLSGRGWCRWLSVS